MCVCLMTSIFSGGGRKREEEEEEQEEEEQEEQEEEKVPDSLGGTHLGLMEPRTVLCSLISIGFLQLVSIKLSFIHLPDQHRPG